ncbi:hypothetical protein CAPN010_08470 [Capnocytophaga cynodegmi]|nr:hypothetical protein CAPN010_08470 [Capnocytophaga cynodegmi]
MKFDKVEAIKMKNITFFSEFYFLRLEIKKLRLEITQPQLKINFYICVMNSVSLFSYKPTR